MARSSPQRDSVALTDQPNRPRDNVASSQSNENANIVDENNPLPTTTGLFETAPDGGYGWIVIFACFVHTFWLNAWTGSWGILQVALLQTTLSHSTSSTLSFIGSLGLAMSVALGIAAVRIARIVGARWASLIGIVLYGVGNVASGFAVESVPGMFIACGLLYGFSSSLMYAMTNSLPVQWFNNKLGTANGVVKLGGGLGATVMALVTGYLTESVGIAWTFRILGFASLATGIPVAFLIKERFQPHNSLNIDRVLFKDLPFSYLFATGVTGVFAIYVPPFFLPYVARSIGLSSSVSAGVVACFNACMAIGRLGSGFACDKLGSMNMLLLTMVLNAVTMLTIWSFASSSATLLVFSILNGIANGAFFVTLPTAVSRHVGPRRAAGAMSIALTGWTPGLLLGNPIAGFLIDATGADRASSVKPYRPAIFYAGVTAVLSAAFALLARLKADRKLKKNI
ncbi:MFS transporter asaE [Paramyrothecium foliicola]|nr:MFS transporter asaE [Paramyrothecium foliicola]